jgi:oligoendopeptidase F
MLSGSTPKDQTLPSNWDLASIYSSMEDPGFLKDFEEIKHRTPEFQALAKGLAPLADLSSPNLHQVNGQITLDSETLKAPESKDQAYDWLTKTIDVINRLYDLYGNLANYLYCSYSTDTTNSGIMAKIDAVDSLMVPLRAALAEFRNTLAGYEQTFSLLANLPEDLELYRFYLLEQLEAQTKQMAPELEDLAADLARSGADSWSRLQEQLSSTMSQPWDSETGTRKTVIELRALAYDPDREVRKKAYQLELKAWEQFQVAFAASLNGVKGASVTLNTRRGWKSTLEKSIFQNRITAKTLDALITAMEESLPQFRRYFQAKARFLGIPKMSFYDIFAPLTQARSQPSSPSSPSNQNHDLPSHWTYDQARSFIVKTFGEFSENLAAFADRAFSQGWIDPNPKPGKVGGAYCIDIPLKKETRILSNFDGSFSSVSTLAHELGHGYHGWVLKDVPAITRDYPMTLAETASIFCETLIYNSAIRSAPETQRIPLLEGLISESAQVIVDILSRFKFENWIMEKRPQGELSAQEFSDLMIRAQKETYRDGLNPEELHPYMWAVKGHYYRSDYAFYNFPYAFGQLFGLGLYSQFLDDPIGFPAKYDEMLQKTGVKNAVDVCREAGFDIESPDFWRKALSSIVEHIDSFCQGAEELDQ